MGAAVEEDTERGGLTPQSHDHEHTDLDYQNVESLCQYLYFSHLETSLKAASGIDLGCLSPSNAYRLMFAAAWQVLNGILMPHDHEAYGHMGVFAVADLVPEHMTMESWTRFLMVVKQLMPPNSPSSWYHYTCAGYPDSTATWRSNIDYYLSPGFR